MKTTMLCLAAVSMLAFGGCAKKTDAPSGGNTPVTHTDQYTINGGPFKNALYYMDNGAGSGGYGTINSGTTSLTVTGTFNDTTQISFDIDFAANTAGTYTLTQSGSNSMDISTSAIGKGTGPVEDYLSNNGATLVITSYGVVGSQITGTFSGSFSNAVYGNVTISGGTFSATRLQ